MTRKELDIYIDSLISLKNFFPETINQQTVTLLIKESGDMIFDSSFPSQAYLFDIYYSQTKACFQ